MALANEKEYGIPAPIILAQGILESNAGTSELTLNSNNHFGIKAGKSWNGTSYSAWDDEPSKSKFRCYSSADESYKDHALLLTSNPCYKKLFDISVFDYRGWATGLKTAGYATASLYAQSLIGIIDQYKLYEINGGVKLRPGKSVVITHYIEIEKPVFDQEYVLTDEEETDEQSMVANATRRYVSAINDVRCTILQPGETLASISRRYDISPADLLKYNEIISPKYINEGDIVFLSKKKKKYNGSQDVYIAQDGDTLYSVAQQFGIQLKHLAKLNNMSAYVRLNQGERINLK